MFYKRKYACILVLSSESWRKEKSEEKNLDKTIEFTDLKKRRSLRIIVDERKIETKDETVNEKGEETH